MEGEKKKISLKAGKWTHSVFTKRIHEKSLQTMLVCSSFIILQNWLFLLCDIKICSSINVVVQELCAAHMAATEPGKELILSSQPHDSLSLPKWRGKRNVISQSWWTGRKLWQWSRRVFEGAIVVPPGLIVETKMNVRKPFFSTVWEVQHYKEARVGHRLSYGF